jgi:hypothetical protein
MRDKKRREIDLSDLWQSNGGPGTLFAATPIPIEHMISVSAELVRKIARELKPGETSVTFTETATLDGATTFKVEVQ